MSAIPEVRTAPSAMPQLTARLRQTFDSGRTRPIEWRLRQLARLDDLLRVHEQELGEALHADLGKSAFEAWLTEIAFTRTEIRHTRRHLARWMKPRRAAIPPALQPGRAFVRREPLGVVLIIAPWNYPLQLAVAPLIAAIAAGNCAIVKPSEVAPHASAALARLLPRYLDQDAIAVVEGGVAETTALLEQKFDHILYTGNGTVGRIVMAAAARHLTPVTLELGGKSPTIVDASADLDVAARRIIWAKFLNAGQTCIAPDYVLVERTVEDRLVGKLADTIHEFFGADPRQSKDYGRIINGRHWTRLSALLGDGEIACGGDRDEADRYIAPTVLRRPAADSPVMSEEIFGPILPVLPVDGIDEAIRFVAARPKPLALYVFSSDRGAIRRVLSGTSSGGACVNDAVMHFAVPNAPFGGAGESGMGAYHGKPGFDTFSHERTVLDKATALDLPLRYPPYTESKKTWLKRLM